MDRVRRFRGLAQREGDPTWDPALSKATWSILGSSIDAGETPVWQPLASSAEQANLPSTLTYTVPEGESRVLGYVVTPDDPDAFSTMTFSCELLRVTRSRSRWSQEI